MSQGELFPKKKPKKKKKKSSCDELKKIIKVLRRDGCKKVYDIIIEYE